MSADSQLWDSRTKAARELGTFLRVLCTRGGRQGGAELPGPQAASGQSPQLADRTEVLTGGREGRSGQEIETRRGIRVGDNGVHCRDPGDTGREGCGEG